MKIIKISSIYILLSIIIGIGVSADPSNNNSRQVELDIGKKTATPEFYYFENLDSDLAVYIPKGNKLISSVKVGPHAKNIYGSEATIWRTDNPKEYADRVEINGVCDWKPTKLALIHTVNGDTKRYCIPGSNQPWAEDDNSERFGGNLLTEHRPAEISIFTTDSSRPNDLSKYEPYEIVHKSGSEYRVVGYHYMFKKDAICNKITHSGVDVWVRDQSKTGNSYPKRIYFNPYVDRMSIDVFFNEGSVMEYALPKGGNWSLTNSSIAGPKDLEITTMENTPDFGFYNNDEIKACVYIANLSRAFKSVRQFNEVLWESKKSGLYADYVMITKMGTKDEQITIHLSDGEIKTCYPLEPVTKGAKRTGMTTKMKVVVVCLSLVGFGVLIGLLVFFYLKKNPEQGL